jgi:hypothetical protein
MYKSINNNNSGILIKIVRKDSLENYQFKIELNMEYKENKNDLDKELADYIGPDLPPETKANV